jgi:hypothetical protein
MIRSLFVLLALSAAHAQHRPPTMEDAGKANLPQQSIGANDLIAVRLSLRRARAHTLGPRGRRWRHPSPPAQESN